MIRRATAVTLWLLTAGMLSLIVSCSDDNKATNTDTEVSPLVGTWELVIVKVDGVVSTPQTDPIYMFYEDEELIQLFQDGTGQGIENGSYFSIVSWEHSADSISIQLEEDDPFTVEYTLQDDTLTLYFPSDSDPDLERLYVGSSQVISVESVPVVITAAVTDITQTTAECGGDVTSDGGFAVTARGVCWSTSPTPTIADSKTIDSAGTGNFTSSLFGLSAGVTYYVRAYATNSEGTGYGDSMSFMTPSGLSKPSVTTSAVDSVSETTVQCGGTVTSDGGATITARGVCWSNTPLPTIANDKTTDGSGTGSFVSAIIGLSGGNVYYVRAYASNSAGTGYGESRSFSTPGVLTPDSTGTATDIDGNVYQTVKIGSQWWMAENLKVTHYRNGDPIPHGTDAVDWANRTAGAFCEYNYDAAHVAIYGRLYNFYAVDDSRNIAPEGWHVPTDDEWSRLELYLGMSPSDAGATGWRGTDEGGRLKDITAYWASPNEGATNASGFSALPGGYATNGLSFQTKGYTAYFWSSTDINSNIAYSRALKNSGSQIFRNLPDSHYGLSVRCVRD